MPGVQVLFAFLLAVPFQQRFETVERLPARRLPRRRCSPPPTATAFLIAPSAYHRIAFQQHEKERIIQMGTRQFVCGLVALAVAMNGAVLLVTDVLFQATDGDRRRGVRARRSSPGCGSASAYGGGGADERARGDPRHRRHARRLQLPAHDRLVPRAAPARPARRRSGASTATSAWAATSSWPRCAATRSRSALGEDIRAAEKALYMALIDEVEPLHGARDLIVDLKRLGRAGRPGQLGQARRDRALPRPARRARAGRRVDERRRRRADQARARPRGGRAGARRRRPAVMIGDSTWDCRAAGQRRRARRSPCSPAASPRRSCARPARSPSSSRSTSYAGG